MLVSRIKHPDGDELLFLEAKKNKKKHIHNVNIAFKVIYSKNDVRDNSINHSHSVILNMFTHN